MKKVHCSVYNFKLEAVTLEPVKKTSVLLYIQLKLIFEILSTPPPFNPLLQPINFRGEGKVIVLCFTQNYLKYCEKNLYVRFLGPKFLEILLTTTHPPPLLMKSNRKGVKGQSSLDITKEIYKLQYLNFSRHQNLLQILLQPTPSICWNQWLVAQVNNVVYHLVTSRDIQGYYFNLYRPIFTFINIYSNYNPNIYSKYNYFAA